MKMLNELIKKAEDKNIKAIVAGANDSHILEAVKNSYEKKIINPVLIGNVDEIKKVAESINFDITKFEIIEANDEIDIATKSVKEVGKYEKSILIKGLINTGTILKFVLNKEFGLNKGNILSHVGIMEIPDNNKLILLSDAALNINPDLDQKIAIINNAIEVAHSIDIDIPKVALIAPNEKVSMKIQSTVDAAIISKMADRGIFKNCIIDGPLALDIAISKEALKIKKIKSPVDGEADILIVPNIDAGNVLYKSLIYYAKAQTAGIIVGALKPVVVTSRADSAQSKMYSIALACVYNF